MMVVLAGVFWINKLLRCSKIVFSVNHLRLIQIVSHATLSGKSCRSKPIYMHSTFQFLVIVDLTSYNMTDSNFWLPETFNQIHAYNWVAQICMQAAIKFYKRGMVTHTLVADALFQTLMLLYNYLVVNICPWRQAITQCFAIWVHRIQSICIHNRPISGQCWWFHFSKFLCLAQTYRIRHV